MAEAAEGESGEGGGNGINTEARRHGGTHDLSPQGVAPTGRESR